MKTHFRSRVRHLQPSSEPTALANFGMKVAKEQKSEFSWVSGKDTGNLETALEGCSNMEPRNAGWEIPARKVKGKSFQRLLYAAFWGFLYHCIVIFFKPLHGQTQGFIYALTNIFSLDFSIALLQVSPEKRIHQVFPTPITNLVHRNKGKSKYLQGCFFPPCCLR